MVTKKFQSELLPAKMAANKPKLLPMSIYKPLITKNGNKWRLREVCLTNMCLSICCLAKLLLLSKAFVVEQMVCC
jgi:hypothetical protein